mmetsp:Transcript_3433/g.5143  ORF Transcript_3433/g.5143 Transcript_3433/m.5143 type:complete len:123 (+) Transcript_3433:436-804(+)
MQFVTQLSRNKFLVWPVKNEIKLQRGLFITLLPEGKTEYKRTAELPEMLLKPGMQAQTKNGKVTDILFLGGNEQKQCYCYNLDTDSWRQAGVLPKFHLVTQQNTVQYNEDQTLSFFTLVNFD